jgi:hypothetical protein
MGDSVVLVRGERDRPTTTTMEEKRQDFII